MIKDLETVRVKKVSEVDMKERASWERFRQVDEKLRSPFLSFFYAESVSKIVSGVRIAIIERENEPVAFLPFEIFKKNVGVRLHWCDYQGVIATKGKKIDMVSFISQCGLRSWDFDHLLLDGGGVSGFDHSRSISPVVEMLSGYDAYLKGRSKDGRSQIKEGERKMRKIERDLGAIEFTTHENSPEILEQLLRWRWSRYPDVRHSLETVSTALKGMLEIQKPEFRGVLTVLRARGEVLAAHFGLRSYQTWHHWFPAFNPDFEKYSPGIVRDLLMIQSMEYSKVNTLDFGKGDQMYKQNFATGAILLGEGSVDADSVLRTARKAKRAIRGWIKRHPIIEDRMRRTYRKITA